jgi:hypothetical protein
MLLVPAMIAGLGLNVAAVAGEQQESPIVAAASVLIRRQDVALTPQAYLPLVARDYAPPPPPTTLITVPVRPGIDAVSWASGGPDHAAAYRGQNFGEPGYGLATTLFPLDYGSYWMQRSYLAVAIPPLDGEVISAGLSLVPCANWATYQDPLPPPVVSFHPGTWPGILAAGRVMWNAWESTRIGEYDTSAIFGLNCYAGETERVVIPLDAAYVRPGQVFKLVVRDSQHDVDLRAQYGNRNRTFGARALEYGATGDIWLEIALGGAP